MIASPVFDPVAAFDPQPAEVTRHKLALVASKGSLDWAYPPLMMANNAAKKGWEVGIVFTFYGLNILHRDKSRHLQISPVGNPAMPMPTPTLLGVIPGMTPLAAWMMRRQFKRTRISRFSSDRTTHRHGGLS